MTKRLPIYVGSTLLMVYLCQYAFGWEWSLLAKLQQDETFKRWSGFSLLLYLVSQWGLTAVRLSSQWEVHTPLVVKVHKWMGALSPLVFYLHAIQIGYSYLFLLSTLYFTNLLVGFLHIGLFKTRAQWYLKSWMVVHVALSLTVVFLGIYHVWIVFYYR